MDELRLRTEWPPERPRRSQVRILPRYLVGKASYKRAENSGVRVALLAAIQKEPPIADPHGRLAMVECEDDYIDALLCALVARAAELGVTHAPTAAQKELAQIEGWIHLPSAALGELALPRCR